MTTERTRPPVTRFGTTSKYMLGNLALYVTVNRDENGRIIEAFGKAGDGHQAELDGLCLLASLCLQHGTDPLLIARHLRYRRYPPHGGPGQPCSISDALGRAIEDAVTKTGGRQK